MSTCVCLGERRVDEYLLWGCERVVMERKRSIGEIEQKDSV